jgi:hypothetical protein
MVIRKIRKITCISSVVVCLTLAGHGQSTVIEQANVVVTRQLAGRVVVGSKSEPVADVKVELCSGDWKTVIATGKTNAEGYFSLGTPAGSLFHLRFSAPGFNIYQMRARVKGSAKRDLTIVMNVAT